MKERIKLSQLLKVKLRSRTSILFYGLDLGGNLRVPMVGKKMVEQERLRWCLMEQSPGNEIKGKSFMSFLKMHIYGLEKKLKEEHSQVFKTKQFRWMPNWSFVCDVNKVNKQHHCQIFTMCRVLITYQALYQKTHIHHPIQLPPWHLSMITSWRY